MKTVPFPLFSPSPLARRSRKAASRSPDGRERQFLDDSDQSPQSCPTTRRQLEADLRVCQAQLTKGLFADKQKYSFVYSGNRSRIVPSVKDRQLSYRTAGTINVQHLLSAAR